MPRHPIVYMLIGLPGAGKSTWARKKVQEKRSRPIVIINRDMLRQMAMGKYGYNKDVESIVKDMKSKCVRACFGRINAPDIIIDETHNTIERRRQTLIDIEVYSGAIINPKIVYVWFRSNHINTLLKRRMQDARGYTENKWRVVISGMAAEFEAPCYGETENMGGLESGTKISEIRKV